MTATIHVRGKAARRLDPRTGMNRTEARYADILEADRRRGVIVRWDYEPETLKLADDCRYTPDFRVILADGTVEFHEVKGTYCRDDAAAKFRVAAKLHPYVFKMCINRKGSWDISEAANKHGH